MQTLNFAKRIVEKHEAALAQLDAGESPREVMHFLRTPNSRQEMRMANRMHSGSRGMEDPGLKDQTPPPMLSKHELQRVRSFIAENLQQIDSQLRKIEAISPEGTEKLLRRLAPKVLDILHLQEGNPTLSTLKLDELKAGLAYVDASRKYRSLLKSESSDQAALNQAEEVVRVAASARFDAQVQIKQFEIHQLTMRIQQLHIALKDLNAQRDDQVQAQVNSSKRTPGHRINHRPGNIHQSDETEHANKEED
jgi:hypothetical protein